MATTVSRLILAACLVALGFMIWGIHKDIYTLTEMAQRGGAAISAKIDGISGQLSNADAKSDKLITLTKGIGTIGKPRTKPIRHLLPAPVKPKPKPQKKPLPKNTKKHRLAAQGLPGGEFDPTEGD